MRNFMLLLTGVGIGAAIMYIFDPEEGLERRATVRTTATNTVNRTGGAISGTAKTLGNRAYGIVSDAKQLAGFTHAPKKEELH
jgi:hypothetical protein